MALDTMYLLRHHKKCLKQNKKSGSIRDYILKYLANEKQKTNKKTTKQKKKFQIDYGRDDLKKI